MTLRWRTAVLACLSVLLGTDFCPASTFTWSGPTGADWFAATNWTPNGVPGANDTINFTGGTINLSAPVTISAQLNWSAGTLTGSPITISSTGVLTTSGGGNETLQNALTNAGTIQLTGSGSFILDGSGGGGQIINQLGGLLN